MLRAPFSQGCCKHRLQANYWAITWYTVCNQYMRYYFLKVNSLKLPVLIQNIYFVPWYYREVRFYCLRNPKSVHRQEDRNTQLYKLHIFTISADFATLQMNSFLPQTSEDTATLMDMFPTFHVLETGKTQAQKDTKYTLVQDEVARIR